MTPFVSTSGQRGLIRRGIWLGSRALVILALAFAALYYGCGRVPPEPFWEPNAEDTAAIRQVVEENKGLFTFQISEAGLIRCTTALPGSTQTILDDELTGNPFKPRFRADSIQHLFYDTAYDFEYTFIATLDTLEQETTCTVSYAETIPGELRMHAYRMTDSLRESLFFPSPGETLRLPLYTDTFVTRSAVVTKPITATTTGGFVLKKEAGQWDIWKVSGGTRFYAPNPDDAPYFVYAAFTGAGRYDTVLLRPDTLHYGMQRLYPFADTATSGVLTYTQNDTIKLPNLLSNLGTDGAEYLYFNGQRNESRKPIILADVAPGLYHLYIEEIPPAVLWEVNGTYSGTIWSIPVRVK